jgi:hypothetical protein
MLKKILLGIVIVIITVIVCILLFGDKSSKLSNVEILFNKNGNVSKYQLTGFGQPESGFAWTIDQEAVISIPMQQIPENHGLRMTVDIYPFLAKKIKKQNVDVFVNDVLVDKWIVDKANVYNIILPKNINVSDGTLNVKFKIKNPKSPKELKLSSDTRKLGIAIKKLNLSVFDADNPKGFAIYSIGKEIKFSLKGDSQKYLESGWSTPEKHFTWTDGKDAYVNMFVKDAKDKKLQLNVSGRCIFDSEKSQYQKVTVYANNTKLTEWDCTHEESVYHAVLPDSVVENGAISIRFNIDKPFVPGADTRNLGIAVKTLSLSDLSASKTKVKIALWLKNKVFKAPENQEQKPAN